MRTQAANMHRREAAVGQWKYAAGRHSRRTLHQNASHRHTNGSNPRLTNVKPNTMTAQSHRHRALDRPRSKLKRDRQSPPRSAIRAVKIPACPLGLCTRRLVRWLSPRFHARAASTPSRAIRSPLLGRGHASKPRTRDGPVSPRLVRHTVPASRRRQLRLSTAQLHHRDRPNTAHAARVYGRNIAMLAMLAALERRRGSFQPKTANSQPVEFE